MKRVLIFSLVYYPHFVGGAEVAIKEITDRLGDDIEFDMVTLRGHDKSIERVGKVHVHRVGSSHIFALSKLLYPLLSVQKASSLHKTRRYDAVWGMMAAYAGFGALFFKLAHPKVPFLLTLQEGDPIPYIKRRAALVYPLFKLIFTRADVIQAISTYLARFGRDMGHVGEITVIPNGVDLTRFVATEHPPVLTAGIVNLVTSSRLVEKNAIDDVIRALVLLPQNVHFVVYGSGKEENSLRSLARELQVSDRVLFKGFLPHKELAHAFTTAHIFVRPSRSEGMGNSFVEAMAAGLPVIATQEGGIVDFLFDEKRNPEKPTTGWAVDKDSPEQIAAAVKDIMTNPDKVLRVRVNAVALVREKYDWNLIADKMRALLESLKV